MNVFQSAFESLKRQFDAIAVPKSSDTNKLKLDVTLKTTNLIRDAITILNERMDAMAISLDGLSAEIDRSNTVTAGAAAKIDQLIENVRLITEELAAVKMVAETSTVDSTKLEELIGKLRTSTDALETTLKK